MPRGLVLPFPSPQRFTSDDYSGLERFAAAVPDAQIDIVIGRDRREVAILAFGGRQLWLSRNGASIHIRNAAGAQRMVGDTSMDNVLAAFQAGLMDGEASSWSVRPKISVALSGLALAGE